MVDISAEIKFKTARSGGKGGQNVNKVETMVEGYWHIDTSLQFTTIEKEKIKEALRNKINSEGFLLVKSQLHRSQLENKLDVIKKMHKNLISALKQVKIRKPTRPTKASKIKKTESKIKAGVLKQNRKKIHHAG